MALEPTARVGSFGSRALPKHLCLSPARQVDVRPIPPPAPAAPAYNAAAAGPAAGCQPMSSFYLVSLIYIVQKQIMFGYVFLYFEKELMRDPSRNIIPDRYIPIRIPCFQACTRNQAMRRPDPAPPAATRQESAAALSLFRGDRLLILALQGVGSFQFH